MELGTNHSILDAEGEAEGRFVQVTNRWSRLSPHANPVKPSQWKEKWVASSNQGCQWAAMVETHANRTMIQIPLATRLLSQTPFWGRLPLGSSSRERSALERDRDNSVASGFQGFGGMMPKNNVLKGFQVTIMLFSGNNRKAPRVLKDSQVLSCQGFVTSEQGNLPLRHPRCIGGEVFQSDSVVLGSMTPGRLYHFASRGLP